MHLIEPERSRDSWIAWLEDESRHVRQRFGSDPEAMIFWPNDYYAKLEEFWSSDQRVKDPIVIKLEGKIGRIVDGWHRVAISHKLNHQTVPATIIE